MKSILSCHIYSRQFKKSIPMLIFMPNFKFNVLFRKLFKTPFPLPKNPNIILSKNIRIK